MQSITPADDIRSTESVNDVKGSDASMEFTQDDVGLKSLQSHISRISEVHK